MIKILFTDLSRRGIFIIFYLWLFLKGIAESRAKFRLLYIDYHILIKQNKTYAKNI